MEDFPLWAIALLGLLTGAICSFLGMAGYALQEWARQESKGKDGKV